jgi:hypothetical protein
MPSVRLANGLNANALTTAQKEASSDSKYSSAQRLGPRATCLEQGFVSYS